MKKFRKLIPALCMLLVSALFVGTSTYAWFSMNKEVTASNMQIKATSDQPYLLISETQNGTFDKSADQMVLDSAARATLKLVTPLNVASNVGYYKDTTDKTAGSTTTPTKFTNAADVLWGTTTSSDPAQVEATNVPNLVGGTGFDNGALKDYVQKSELWFKVAAPDQNGSNLKCTKVTFTKEDGESISAAGRVLLVTEDGKYQLFKFAENGTVTAETGSDTALLASVTTTATKVTAYFYFDGTDSSAYTNNATNLAGINASFNFTID